MEMINRCLEITADKRAELEEFDRCMGNLCQPDDDDRDEEPDATPAGAVVAERSGVTAGETVLKPPVGLQIGGVADDQLILDARESEDITNAFIGGIGSDDNALGQMRGIIRLLDAAGYEIVKKERLGDFNWRHGL